MLVGKIKSPSGLIRVEMKVRGNEIIYLKFTGDFFFYPEDQLRELEKLLEGKRPDLDEILDAMKTFYDSEDIRSPSLEPEHFCEAIKEALRDNDEA